MFAELSEAYIYGQWRSIENDLFSRFDKLTSLNIEYLNFENTFKRQGIEWVKSINHGLRIDISNDTQIAENKNRLCIILLAFLSVVYRSSESLSRRRLLCLQELAIRTIGLDCI